MISTRLWLFAVTPILLNPLSLAAQSFEEEFPPGLLARYSSGETSILRVDDRISFDWKTNAPDPRLPSGPFSAEWSALQLIRKNSAYQFALYLQGDAELMIDGQSVLKASSKQPEWYESEPVDLKFGEHEFELRYQKTSERATIKLYWSSDAFPLEPIPRELFFREEPWAAWKDSEVGRKLVISRRCQNCHETDLNLPTLAAPSLSLAGNHLPAAWIVEQLTNTQSSATRRMPHYQFSPAEANDVAAYLKSVSKQMKLKSLPKTKQSPEDELREGRTLFHSRGCLACHQMQGLGNSDEFAGTALDDIGRKRSVEWLYHWLRDPKSLNPDHRMPIIELTNQERRQLAVYLAETGDASDQTHGSGNTERGKQLMTAARCANCHNIPGLKPDLTGIPTWAKLNHNAGCLDRSLSKTKPSYQAQQLDTKAVGRFMSQHADTPSQYGTPELGQQLLEVNNCIQCHPRGRSQGIVPVAGKVAQSIEWLQGESERLIPPSLDAIGDKLKDGYLLKSVRGAQPRRMDWLAVRMPKFSHNERDAKLLAQSLMDRDRIPENAPDPHIFSVPPDAKPTSEELLQANTLVGPRGFSCVACHSLGDYTPRNVALGTRGSNLLNIGERMRSSYFIRWTRSPIRIVPGMEMPSIGQKPIKDLLDGDSDRQLAVIWKGLNSPDFTIPTDPSSVEQYWVVAPDERTRVIRDVFELRDEEGEGYVPRAFAVGFNNQHSVLFDLDRFEPRVWTYGDFARQKTEGKSWYWNMAGVPVESWPTSSHGGFRIQHEGELIAPVLDQARVGKLTDYLTGKDGVRLVYTLSYNIAGIRNSWTINERWMPIYESPQGWSRRISRMTFSGDDPELAEGMVFLLGDSAVNDSGKVSISTREDIQNGPDGKFVNIGRKGFTLSYRQPESEPFLAPKPKPVVINEATPITSAPGFEGVRLPLRGDIMPTGINWDRQERLIFTSLKGDLLRATDSNNDGIEDHLDLLAEGLSAPYGVIPHTGFVPDGQTLLVAHKPELLELKDADEDGYYERARVFATGWGHSDNYHDWTCGFAKGKDGFLYFGLGSDYSQKNRPEDRSRWRGSVLRVSSRGHVEPIAHSFRYPTGIAVDPQGRIFATDNQGVQNTFNELNHIQEGRYYGVPSRYEENRDAPITPPAIQIPHPWTRSVNGITFIPEEIPALAPFAGHGLGAEYNSRLLIRFTIQEVDGTVQGATYYFTKPIVQATPDNFIGPISVAVSKQGEIYVGSILDSGWLGGQNIGAIAKLTPKEEFANGIRELTATPDGFRLEFFHAVDREEAMQTENYQISGYTREWSGSYATPDKDRHRTDVTRAILAEDSKTVDLVVDGRREGFVYEVTAQDLETDDQPLFPQTGHYTLHKIPKE